MDVKWFRTLRADYRVWRSRKWCWGRHLSLRKKKEEVNKVLSFLLTPWIGRRNKCLTQLNHDVGNRWRKYRDVGKNCINRSFFICIPAQILLGRWNEGGWTRGILATCGGRSEMNREFWWGNKKERDHVLDLAINVGVILTYILKTRHDVDWIYVNQNRNRRRGVVNTVTKFWVHKIWRKFWLYEKILVSQRGMYSLEWFSHCYSVVIFSHRILIVYTTFPNTGRGVASEDYSWCFCVISRIRGIAHQHPNPTI